MSMSTVPKSTRMYSWWWDSHISPKNSKWLKENLEDMDDRVRTMIKLIEEDADSFGRRAEMYYEKRPVLMKLVEEFYREYRALAERYDHANGIIYQAHRTMAKVFPNQISPLSTDDSLISSVTEVDPHTPEMQLDMLTLFTPGDLLNDDIGLSLSYLPSGKQMVSGGNVKKTLKFDEPDEENQGDPCSNNNMIYDAFSEMEEVNRSANEIGKLKDAISKFQEERDATLARYQTALDTLNHLEIEVSHAQSDCKVHSERASKAETEVNDVRETFKRLQWEKEETLAQYKQCLDKMSFLENILSHTEDEFAELTSRTTHSEIETQVVNDALTSLKIEAALFLQQSSEITINLENKLMRAEEEMEREKETALKAKKDVENFEKELILLAQERDTIAFKCQQYEERISTLEEEIICLQGEANRLYIEADDRALRLKQSEEYCQVLKNSNRSLHSKIESLLMKLGTQCRELTEKHKESGNLWTCMQEERLRFKEVEAAFEALQFMHFQSQEQLKYLSTKLEEEGRRFHTMEARNQNFQNAASKFQEENRRLNEVNLSLSLSSNTMRHENAKLTEKQEHLEKEVAKNSFLEISLSSMDSELESLKENVKALLIEESALISDKENLLSQFQLVSERFEKLVNVNTLLENSLSDTCTELECTRAKLKSLEDSYYSLRNEKSQDNLERESESTLRKLAESSFVEVEEQFGRNLCAQIEILVLQKHIESMTSEKYSVLIENRKVLDSSRESERLVHVLQRESSPIHDPHPMIENRKLLDSSRESENHSMHEGKKVNSNTTVELWETSDQDGSIDLRVTKVRKGNDESAPIHDHHPMMRDSEEEEDRRKVLDRLQSDARKLTNLRMTLVDLKTKMGTTRKNRSGKGGEYDGVEGQLEGAEETVVKLLDVIWKLKAVQEKDGRDLVPMGRNMSLRQRVLKQAQRVSDRIGRLQVEVQKIEAVLVKIGSIKEGRKRFRIYARKTKVLLQDYLSQSLRTNSRRRRAAFCACAQPRTSGD